MRSTNPNNPGQGDREKQGGQGARLEKEPAPSRRKSLGRTARGREKADGRPGGPQDHSEAGERPDVEGALEDGGGIPAQVREVDSLHHPEEEEGKYSEESGEISGRQVADRLLHRLEENSWVSGR